MRSSATTTAGELAPPRRGLSQEDRAAFTDARIAALKAGLRLTPDQEKNWSAFETALRDIAEDASWSIAPPCSSDEPRPDDPVVRLRRQAEMMTNAGATLKRLADAQEPLYQSLDDSQKNRFKMLCAHPYQPARAFRADARAARHDEDTRHDARRHHEAIGWQAAGVAARPRTAVMRGDAWEARPAWAAGEQL